MSDVEPLKLADGTLIYPEGEEPEKEQSLVEIPRHDEAVEDVTYRRRRLSELPETPDRMNVLSVILTYHILGVSNYDIATVLGISETRVERVLLSDTFIELQRHMADQILEKDADEIRSVFSRGAKKAARRVERIIEGEDDTLALSASKDFLDRAGHRPVDIVEHKHKLEGGLTINYVQKKDESRLIDVVDIDFTEHESD